MPIANKMLAVERAAVELRSAEGELEAARLRFQVALREAHEAGASYGMLGRTVGLSRQRIAEIVKSPQ